jgi:hypothetical protein
MEGRQLKILLMDVRLSLGLWGVLGREITGDLKERIRLLHYHRLYCLVIVVVVAYCIFLGKVG